MRSVPVRVVPECSRPVTMARNPWSEGFDVEVVAANVVAADATV